MKFSTRKDTDLPAEELFTAVSDFDRLERVLMHRGAQVNRIDPSQEPGTGMGWKIGFDWRGRHRVSRLEMQRYKRPEGYSLVGGSEAFDTRIDITVVALSRLRSRVIFEVDIRPRNMKARLLLQTAKLGKSQLDQKFERGVNRLLGELAAPAA